MTHPGTLLFFLPLLLSNFQLSPEQNLTRKCVWEFIFGDEDEKEVVIVPDARIENKTYIANFTTTVNISVPLITNFSSNVSISSNYDSQLIVISNDSSSKFMHRVGYNFTANIISIVSNIGAGWFQVCHYLSLLQSYFVKLMFMVFLLALFIVKEWHFWKEIGRLSKKVEGLEHFFNLDEELEGPREETDVVRLFLPSYFFTADSVFQGLKKVAELSVSDFPVDDVSYMNDDFLRKLSYYVCRQENVLETLHLLRVPETLHQIGIYYHNLTKSPEDEEKEMKIKVKVFVNEASAEEKKD